MTIFFSLCGDLFLVTTGPTACSPEVSECLDDPLPLLVARLRQGDKAALAATFDLLAAPLHAFLRRLGGSSALADDLLQDTFVQLARHADRLRPDTVLRAWLFTVARNRYRSQRRTSQSRAQHLQTGSEPLSSTPPLAPDDSAALVQLGGALEQALASLDESSREVLLLIGVEHMEQVHAAQILGLSPVALRKRLSRARALLVEALHKAGHSLGPPSTPAVATTTPSASPRSPRGPHGL